MGTEEDIGFFYLKKKHSNNSGYIAASDYNSASVAASSIQDAVLSLLATNKGFADEIRSFFKDESEDKVSAVVMVFSDEFIVVVKGSEKDYSYVVRGDGRLDRGTINKVQSPGLGIREIVHEYQKESGKASRQFWVAGHKLFEKYFQ